MSYQESDNNTQELMSIFQVESEEILERIFDNLMTLETKPTDNELIATLYRELHSIKGAVRMVGFNNIQDIVHKIENVEMKEEAHTAVIVLYQNNKISIGGKMYSYTVVEKNSHLLLDNGIRINLYSSNIFEYAGNQYKYFN